jgi:spermidine synthase
VAFAEIDEKVVAFSRAYLSSINKRSFDDRRVTAVFTDGRRFVEQHPGQFDVVIMDMTDPYGPSKMLYTRQFFTAVKRSFRNRDGIFVMHSDSPITRPRAFSSIVKTLSSVFRHVNTLYTYVQMYATLWSISISSDTVKIASRRAPEINRRLRRRGISRLHHYNGATHEAMLVTYPYIERIRRRKGRIVTDTRRKVLDTVNPNPSPF